jgi:hypothetical protein
METKTIIIEAVIMRHNDNVSKHSKCSITVEELYKRVSDWDIKYKN